MKPAEIFDIVHERVKECRAQMQSTGSAWPDELPHGGGLPRVGNQHAEYIADFALAGRRTLFPWPDRLEVFRRYYVRGERPRRIKVEAKQQTSLGSKYAVTATKLRLGKLVLSEGTFRWWCSEIKKSVAPELERRGIYPPSEYKRKTVVEDESDYTTEFLNVAEFREGGNGR